MQEVLKVHFIFAHPVLNKNSINNCVCDVANVETRNYNLKTHLDFKRTLQLMALIDQLKYLVAKFVYWSNKAISAPSTTSIYIKNQIFTNNKRNYISFLRNAGNHTF
jgi:hypothetical protein